MQTPMRHVAVTAAVVSIASVLFACVDTDETVAEANDQAITQTGEQVNHIELDIDGTVLTATLEDNAAARDFASLLPLTLTLKDYAATEKVSDLPRKLSTKGLPTGFDPSVGDITYYAPWGNLALFYKDFGYAAGLVKLGAIQADIDILRRPGPLRVVIKKVE